MLWMLLSGGKLWNYTTGSYVESSPAVVNGIVYIGSDDGNAYALGGSPTSTPTPTFTASQSPAIPEFPNQALGITLFISLILSLVVVILELKKITWKIQRGQPS